MLRRALTFLLAVLVVGSVASLVYFNSQPTTLQWAPRHEITMPLAWLILGSTGSGALLVFLVLLAREGHWALRHWRVVRALRASERNAARRSEARASLLAGRHAKARTLLSKTAIGAGAHLDDALDYAETFLDEGRAAEARNHLEDTRQELGDDPRILHALARCCRAEGDHAGAVAALDRGVESMPASIALQVLLRDSLVDLGWWSRAEVAQQRLVDLLPADRTQRQRLIEIRMKAAESGDAAEREGALRGVLAMDPSWPAAATARAAMLAAEGRRRSALRVLVRAANRRPAEETLAALDEALEQAGPRRTQRAWKKLRRLHPADASVILHQAAHLVRLGDAAGAEAVLRQLEGGSGLEASAVEGARAALAASASPATAVALAELRRALPAAASGD